MNDPVQTDRAERSRWFKACFVPALGLTFLALVAGLSRSENQAQHPGSEPYSPTKLEWFALQLQANYGQTYEDLGTTVRYLAEAPDTIVIHVRYLPQAGISEDIEGYAALVREAAQARGYDWVRVRGDARMVELDQGIYDGLKAPGSNTPQ